MFWERSHTPAHGIAARSSCSLAVGARSRVLRLTLLKVYWDWLTLLKVYWDWLTLLRYKMGLAYAIKDIKMGLAYAIKDIKLGPPTGALAAIEPGPA